MFGTSWKYSLGRKFNVKWSIMHTYHTYLPYGNSHITYGNLAGQSSGNPFVIHFNWCFMDFKRFSLILIDLSLICLRLFIDVKLIVHWLLNSFLIELSKDLAVKYDKLSSWICSLTFHWLRIYELPNLSTYTNLSTYQLINLSSYQVIDS